MTTLAYRHGVLAADSLTTSNGYRDGQAIKIRKLGPLLVGGCGTSAICEQFVDWVKNGMKGDSPWTGKDAGNSMVVLPDDTILVWGHNGPWRSRSDFYAMGSGELLALGAMAHGANAAEAVEAAMRFDVHSGGPVRTIYR
jgi:hypothetical protein